MQYQVSLAALMDFFCQGEHQGFAEEEIQAAEQEIGAKLPVPYRNFLKTYGRDPINDLHNHINRPPEEIVTSYSCIQEVLQDWSEDFEQAKALGEEAEYQDNGYFTLWQLPQEKWPAVTDNYVLIWYENQGVWNAGYRLSDLQKGLPDPPIYISTNDDYIAFAKCADDLDTFLLQMLWDAGYGYHGGVRLTDPVQIEAALSQAGIDRSRLRWQGNLSVCMDGEGKTLYFYAVSGEAQTLCTAHRDKPAL